MRGGGYNKKKTKKERRKGGGGEGGSLARSVLIDWTKEGQEKEKRIYRVELYKNLQQTAFLEKGGPG